ncbi:MAG: SMC-Scp complex subunit ScpB [bacterium]|nr:SMC-Scp complex subunit ScpB [bacterium]
MKREIEALLFATDTPLTMVRLKKLLPGTETTEIRQAIKELDAEYETAENAFTVVEFGGGWQIATRPEYSPIVERMLKGRRFSRLSKAGLEVLAIIAYRQPLTRLEVDEIRGVNSSGAISTLTERNLATVVGRSQAVGNPLLYGTTREFLNHLGLKGLGQLPDLPDLENVMEDRDQLKEFASKIGRDVSDEELEDYFTAPEEQDHDSETDQTSEIEEESAPETTEEAEDTSEDSPIDQPVEEDPKDHGQPE